MKNKRLEERRKKIPEWIDKAVKYYFDRIDDNKMNKSVIEILSEVSGYDEIELSERISDIIIQPIDALTAMNIVKLLAAPAVSKSVSLEGRELLLAYNDFINQQEGDGDQPTTFNVDLFLSQQ